MLTPEQLSNCANDIIDLYQQLDEQIARDIARRIVKAGYLTNTADWQIRMLQECGMLQEDIITAVSKYSSISEETLKELFKDTASTSVAYDMSIYSKAGLNPLPLNMSPRAMQTLEAGFNKTNGNLQNLTRTTAITSQTAFINACTIAEMKVSSGAFDYNTAIIDAIKQVAENGAWVQYPSGHRDRLDVAVRRNVITGIGQTIGEICLGYARDMECDLMEITAHAGARPSHSAWQGQIVSLSGKKGYLSLEDIGYGSGDGFKGWNCRHDWFPYFEGKMYSAKDLKALEDRNIKYPDGSMHTYYEAEQKQRAYERQIREYKRILSAFDEAIKNTNDNQQINKLRQEFGKQSVKLKSKEAELKNFCKKTGILQDSSRVRVIGFNRSVSQKAVKKSKQYHNVQSKKCNINKRTLAEQEKSDIIKPKLNEQELGAINIYISSESYKINEKLRSGEPLNDSEKEFVNNLDSALNKMPNYEGTVYRSLSSDMIENLEKFLQIHSIDNIVSYEAFTSSSTSVYDRDMDIQMEIKSKNGKDIRNYNAKENEILFGRNSIFKVVNVKDSTIYLEEV